YTLDDGGAAGAVASDQRYRLVLADIERDAAEDVRRAAEGINIVDFEQHALPSRLCRQRGAEEDIGDVLVRFDLLRRTVGEKRTLVHHDATIGIAEYHIHVSLDDLRVNCAYATVQSDRVLNLILLVVAAPLCGREEKQQLGPHPISDRHIQELAFALRQAAGKKLAFVAQTELAK